MLRTKPILRYSGITIILANPSRFDKLSLLCSTGGVLMNELLQPELNIMQCDIRLADDKSPFLPNTKVILLLGEYSLHKYVKESKENTLNELRGSPFYVHGIPAIASFFPQDSADIRSYEQERNELSKEYTGDDGKKEQDDEGDVKRFSPTKRANYAFWLKQDVKKVKRLLKQQDPYKWVIEKEPKYEIMPHPSLVIGALESTQNQFMEFDIETDYEEQNLLCFAFSFWDSISDINTIYSVPILDYNYSLAYSKSTFNIIRSLTLAISRNTLVAYNGAGFDFLVLPNKYKIPIKKMWDPMISQHRIYPDIEKSLGHVTSLWTNQKFHKDTDSQAYRTKEHMMDKLKYCGKDVFTMWLVHKAQTEYARTIPGLEESIALGQRSIRPYITCSMQGIKYDEDKVDQMAKENDRLMFQYIRIINMLMGPTAIAEAKTAVKKSKALSIASSNAQACDYFFRQLDYPVQDRSPTTHKPSLGKVTLYKLALQFPDNPVILFICMFRQIQKEYEALTFFPWKDNNNQIIPYKDDKTEEEFSFMH